MKINKTIVCLFFSIISILACVCYGQEVSDKSGQNLHIEGYFESIDIDRFEDMFKSGEFDLEYHSKERGKILHYAALTGSLDRVKLLLEKGADVNQTDENGKTPLLYAAMNGNLELVQYLIKQGADINVKSNFGWTVMHSAAQSGNLELIRWLAEQGAIVNSKVYLEQSLLYISVFYNNQKQIEWLIDHGANFTITTDILLTPLIIVCGHPSVADTDSLEMVQWFVEHGSSLETDGTDALFFSVYSGKKKLAKWLIEQDVDVNAVYSDGNTVLNIACLNNDLDLVRLLIEHGANANPNLGNKLLPYWFELWRVQRESSMSVNYPLIKYLMLHDKKFAIGLLIAIIGVIITTIWILYRFFYPRRKNPENN